MNILIDAFGGDHAPLEVIQGAVRAVQELGVTVTLVGAENQIRQCAEEHHHWTDCKFCTLRQCSTFMKSRAPC